MSYLVKTYKSDRSDRVLRFSPKYWTLDMPLECSGSIRTLSSTSVRADCVFRRNADLVGIMWSSNMAVDHPRYRYQNKQDYTGLIWEFVIELTGTRARLDALYGASLAIDTADGKSHNVRLWNYRTDTSNTDPYKQRIRIPFTEDLYSGYAKITAASTEEAKTAARVPVDSITRIMLPITPRDYLGGPATLGVKLQSGARSLTVLTSNGCELSPGDVITVPTSDGGGYELAIAGAAVEEGDPVAHASDWGDVVFEWPAPAGFTGPTYEVSVKDGAGTWEVLGTTTKTWFDFPVEESIPMFGWPPSWLEWRVRVVGEMSPFVDQSASVSVDNSFVTVVVPFLGQSNAVGHYTTLSGANKDTNSAGTFRRALASSL